MAKDLQVSVLLDYYGVMLTQKQHTLVELYYNQDFSLSEIAEIESITRQGASDGIKRAESYLRELEEKLGMIKRDTHTVDCVKKIITAAEKIKLGTDAFKYAADIVKTAKKIEFQLR